MLILFRPSQTNTFSHSGDGVTCKTLASSLTDNIHVVDNIVDKNKLIRKRKQKNSLKFFFLCNGPKSKETRVTYPQSHPIKNVEFRDGMGWDGIEDV